MVKKITIISEDYPPNYGGISEWARGISENMYALGYKVNVICKYVSYVDNNLSWPFEVEYLKKKTWKRKRALHWKNALLEQLSKGNNPDLVICTKWSTSKGLVHLCKQYSIPLITVVHGTEVTGNLNWYKRWRLRSTLNNSDRVISVSQFTADFLLNKYLTNGKNIRVLPNGVDLNKFGFTGNVDKLKQMLGLGNKKVIMTLSRVIERKGHDLVLRALPQLVKNNKNIIYVIAGPCTESEKQRLMKLASQLGVKSYIKMTGYVDACDMNSMYQMCDVYCMPSRVKDNGDSEGFGITFLEANACRKPVIGGRSGGCGDAIVDGETGYLVDPHDANELANKIEYLLDHPLVANTMGDNGYKRIEKEFNWQTITKKLADEMHIN